MNREEFITEFCMRYNIEEMKDLCFALDITAEEFLYPSKQAFAREFILHCERHRLIDQLLEKIKRDHPKTDWTFPTSNPRVMGKETVQYAAPSDSLMITNWVYMEDLSVIIREYEKIKGKSERLDEVQALRFQVRCYLAIDRTAKPKSLHMRERRRIQKSDGKIMIGYQVEELISVIKAIYDEFLLQQKIEERFK